MTNTEFTKTIKHIDWKINRDWERKGTFVKANTMLSQSGSSVRIIYSSALQHKRRWCLFVSMQWKWMASNVVLGPADFTSAKQLKPVFGWNIPLTKLCLKVEVSLKINEMWRLFRPVVLWMLHSVKNWVIDR